MQLLATIGTVQWLILASVFIIPIIAFIDIMISKFPGHKKLFWAILVILLPGIGVVLYLLFGVTQKIVKAK